MEPERLKRDFGDRLAFHGGIDIIGVLPRGTPEEVRAEARRVISALSPGGGYILASSHHIQADTPSPASTSSRCTSWPSGSGRPPGRPDRGAAPAQAGHRCELEA